MNFVLIDYKGGSAFKDCAHLPHTVGMVSDLDATSPSGLSPRCGGADAGEEILPPAGAKDIEDYWEAARARGGVSRRPGFRSPPLPGSCRDRRVRVACPRAA